MRDQFPDGQLYVNLRGFDPTRSPMSSAAAIRTFLDPLDVAPHRIPAGPEAQIGLYRSLLADRRMLILLDNAFDAEQVRPLLPGAPGCLVLVTSRNQLTSLAASDGAHLIMLDLLTDAEAHELLVTRLGAERVWAEPDAAEEIINRCARLPLALAIVAARAAANPQFPLAALAEELRHAQGSLDAFQGGDAATNVRTVFSWSYNTVSPKAARLFRLLGNHPGPDITALAAASLAGLPVRSLRPVLTELTSANLIAEHSPGRYAFHDLLRVYATEQAETDEAAERLAATHRMLDHYLRTAYNACRLLMPARETISLAPPQPGTSPEMLVDHRQAMDWFTAERTVLLAAVDHAAATGCDTHTWQLAWTVTDFLSRGGHWQDDIAVQRAALAAAERLDDVAVQARAHRLLALDFTQLGGLDEAHTHLQCALDLAMRAEDQLGQAHTHNHLALMWERQGRYDQTLHHGQQALVLFQATGDQPGQADALNAIGWSHTQLGNHEQALIHCQQALTLQQKLGNRSGLPAILDSLGYAHHQLGQYGQAVTCYQHSFEIHRDLGNRYYEADVLTHLGDTHHATGETHAARAAWQQALDILIELDHPRVEEVRDRIESKS